MALQMTWQQRGMQRRKAGPPLGLKNLGNTCYLNSVLQCLTYTPPLAQFCLASQHSSLCKSVFTNRDKECPFCILEWQIARSLSLDGPLEPPSKIQKFLTLFAEHFRWGRQEDAHEFLRYVIDACHNTSLKLHKRLAAISGNAPNGIPKPAAERLGEAAEGAGTVMMDIFGGALLSQVKCLTCKGESNKTDEIMDISLDLFQSNSLKDALARFFQPEVLDGNNKYSCGKCKKLSVARKQMFILRAPNVLVIQLKRFEGIHGGKINRNIEFEEVLLLSKFMYNATQDAFGRWYCCNDAHVSLSSTQEVLSQKVYILFYVRSNQSPRSSKTSSPCNFMKSLDSNGSGVLLSSKSAEGLKPPIIKPNGVSSVKSNGSIMLKNGKISQNPQIKNINLKNLGIKRAISNGNDSTEVCNSVSAPKDSKAPKCSSSNETKVMHKVEVSSEPYNNAADESISSNSVTYGSAQTLSVPDGNGCFSISKVEVHKDNGVQGVEAVRKDLDCDNSSSRMITKCHSGVSAFKRKSCDSDRVENSVQHTKQSSNLSREDVLFRTRSTCFKEQFIGELEKFKEVLAKEARSELQTCGWVHEVDNFMRTRKKSYLQAAMDDHVNGSIKRHLVLDARKTFNSQIPESVREHFIKRFKSFSNGKLLWDT
uniref:ubiquitinyl hydrolase 1 n=1 Tax=Elaeis guineensis var. tenera TaxID=51953 RepID=A0A6I9SBR3_ELAGV|nr:ubiquitin carboxyl-terminal hydrolase 25 isoform X2 [Elaeis guineensis]